MFSLLGIVVLRTLLSFSKTPFSPMPLPRWALLNVARSVQLQPRPIQDKLQAVPFQMTVGGIIMANAGFEYIMEWHCVDL